MRNWAYLPGMAVAMLLVASGCGKDAKQPAPSPPPPPSRASVPTEPPQLLGPASRPDADKENVATASKACNSFGYDLYAQIASSKQGENLCFSPVGICSGLAMASAGARGNTLARMLWSLHVNMPAEKLHPAIGALLFDLRERPSTYGTTCRLDVINALWPQKGGVLLPEYLSTVQKVYGADCQTLDFVGNSEAARKSINAWAGNQTQGQISELFAPGVLNSLTRLVLTDAVCFKGKWEEPFRAEKTKEGLFKLANGQTVPAQMMNEQADYAYYEEAGFKALELDYGNYRLSMLFLLPYADDGLPEVERNLEVNLTLAARRLLKKEVVVSIPKFRFTSDLRLDEPLKTLGMGESFDRDKADFSGVNGARQPALEALHLEAVIHKTAVEIDEKGTEAKAITGLIEAAKDAEWPAGMEPPKPKTFIADHPFVFAIRDRQTGAILFLGRVMNPAPGSLEATPKK